MTLKNAISQFNRLVSESTKKSEIKVYKDFIKILSNLENRSFTKSELQSIETELEALNLNSTTTKNIRHFKKALQQFKRYLEETFSFITKGHYINLGISIGGAVGLLFGIIFLSGLARSLGISLGFSVGTLIGIVIASYLESQAKSSGNLI
jgi:ElaB/YqjD/DUF883 family membrane-anchored ribosome-binding protein